MPDCPALDDLDLSGIKMGLNVIDLRNPFFMTMADAATKEAERLGIELAVNDSRQVLGVLSVLSDTAGALDAQDQLVLEGLCGQIATAVKSLRLFNELKRARDSLERRVEERTTELRQEIAERKRTEKAMIQASRMEVAATLAGGFAHKVNNLMEGVLGYAELLKHDFADHRNALNDLETISRSAQKAGQLAQQMLAFAHGGQYRPQVVNLNNIIHQVAQLQERSTLSRISIEQDTAPDLWAIHADPTHMSQIFLSFLTNAVEAIADSGHITITTHNVVLKEGTVENLDPGQYVRLTVQDTGHGMSAEVQARVFEPFFTTKFQGRGLGLSAVYGIVQNHGGHISVDSVEGQGTTFEVYLPALPAALNKH
jgi:signal transduction histidine kinase